MTDYDDVFNCGHDCRGLAILASHHAREACRLIRIERLAQINITESVRRRADIRKHLLLLKEARDEKAVKQSHWRRWPGFMAGYEAAA